MNDATIKLVLKKCFRKPQYHWFLMGRALQEGYALGANYNLEFDGVVDGALARVSHFNLKAGVCCLGQEYEAATYKWFSQPLTFTPFVTAEIDEGAEFSVVDGVPVAKALEDTAGNVYNFPETAIAARVEVDMWELTVPRDALAEVKAKDGGQRKSGKYFLFNLPMLSDAWAATKLATAAEVVLTRGVNRIVAGCARKTMEMDVDSIPLCFRKSRR